MASIWAEPIRQLEQITQERGGTVTFRMRRDGERFLDPIVVCAEWPIPGGFQGGESSGTTPELAARQLLFSLRYGKLVPCPPEDDA